MEWNLLTREEKFTNVCSCHPNIKKTYIPQDGEKCYGLCLHPYQNSCTINLNEGDMITGNVVGDFFIKDKGLITECSYNARDFNFYPIEDINVNKIIEEYKEGAYHGKS